MCTACVAAPTGSATTVVAAPLPRSSTGFWDACPSIKCHGTCDRWALACAMYCGRAPSTAAPTRRSPAPAPTPPARCARPRPRPRPRSSASQTSTVPSTWPAALSARPRPRPCWASTATASPNGLRRPAPALPAWSMAAPVGPCRGPEQPPAPRAFFDMWPMGRPGRSSCQRPSP
jgi:hypothetical protein